MFAPISSFGTKIPPINQPAIAAPDEAELKFDGLLLRNSSRYLGVEKIVSTPTFVAYVYAMDRETGLRRKGKFDDETYAARARDIISLKLWGNSVHTNFPKNNYKNILETIADMPCTDAVAAIRRVSTIIPWSISKYYGVIRHARTGKWVARFGPYKHDILGYFESEEEAAKAYDIESIKSDGYGAKTNFDIKRYDVKAIRGLKGKAPSREEAKPLKHSSPSKKDASKMGSLVASTSKPQAAILKPNFSHSGVRMLPSTYPRNSKIDFRYGKTSAFKLYTSANSGEPSETQDGQNKTPTDFEDPTRVMFSHASSSCFKPYVKRM